MQSHVAQDGAEHLIFLLIPLECWGYKCVPLCSISPGAEVKPGLCEHAGTHSINRATNIPRHVICSFILRPVLLRLTCYFLFSPDCPQNQTHDLPASRLECQDERNMPACPSPHPHVCVCACATVYVSAITSSFCLFAFVLCFTKFFPKRWNSSAPACTVSPFLRGVSP